MAEGSDKDQKTEQPTAKKLADSAREGDVLMSRELATALMMLAAAGWIVAAGGWFVQSAGDLVRRGLTLNAADVADFAPAEALMRNGVEILLPLASLFALALGAAVAGPAMLGSTGWRGKALHFKGNRMSPMAGLKRMFGMQGATELGKAIAKVLLLGAIGYWLVASSLPAIMSMAQADLIAAIGLAGKAIGHAMLTLAGGLVVIALIDVPVQWFQRNKRLMMSKQEIKEEMRQSDGAPEHERLERFHGHHAAAVAATGARHLFHRARRPRDPRGIVRRGRDRARLRLPARARGRRRHRPARGRRAAHAPLRSRRAPPGLIFRARRR